MDGLAQFRVVPTDLHQALREFDDVLQDIVTREIRSDEAELKFQRNEITADEVEDEREASRVRLDWIRETLRLHVVPMAKRLEIDCQPFADFMYYLDLGWPGQAPDSELCRISRRLLLEAAIPTDPDGPCQPFTWRVNGDSVAGEMQPAAWRMVNELFSTEGRSASYDELKLPVYRDAEHVADGNAFGSLRRGANDFFEKHNIPYRVSIKKTTVSLLSQK